MKVFISWSGSISLKVAQIFREWLPSVIQSIEPYVSSEDIDKGARWSTDIATELADSTFGILCVTKDNLQAPWLSFEAGALSKTMEKSFVTPFLFGVKRSEVNGPILQFQSTIFEKEDIKKLLKSLNKASGEFGISDGRLDSAFDVWYPTLENKLNELKNTESSINVNEKEPLKESSSEILEEILELSRDNQKLLKTPDAKLYENIEIIKDFIEKYANRNIILNERRREGKKFNIMFLEDVIHNFRDNSYGFLIALSMFKDDFPWIFEMGKELLDVLENNKSIAKKSRAIRDFREMVDFTCNHPMMRDINGRQRDSAIMTKELYYFIMRYCDEVFSKYVA